MTVVAGPTSQPATGEAPRGEPAYDDRDRIPTPGDPRPGSTVAIVERSTRTPAGARGGSLRPEGGFPDAGQLARLMVEAGLVEVTVRRFGLGAVALHVGRVPG